MALLHECVVALPPTRLAPARARAASREALRDWGLRHVVDDAVLVVSELVANCFRHGLPPYSLALRHSERSLDIEVHDDGAGKPVLVMAGADATSGRGLAIVTAIAETVQVAPMSADGKSIIATLRV